MKYDVFISYSRKDTAIADQICEAFDKAGISYFIDRQGIGGGMEFPKVLAPAIRESEIFLLLASQNSYDSAFTDREITFAFNKKRGEKMLPYIIDDTPLPEHLELIFSTNNWLTLKLHPIEPKLVDDVFRLLGRTRSVIESASQPKQKEVIPPAETDNETDIEHAHEISPQPKQKTVTDSTTKAENELELIAKKEGDKWGFIDKQGRTIIPFEYDYATSFSEGLGRVAIGNRFQYKFGFIDKLGNVIIPFKYDSAIDFSEGLAKVIQNHKWGFIDKQGNVVIPFEYETAVTNLSKGFSEGFACVIKNNKWGFIDKQNHIVVPFEYNEAWDFSEGLACVKKNGKLGFIDKQGRVVIPFQYEDYISYSYSRRMSEGVARVIKNGKWGFINAQGDVVVPFEYEEAWDFSEGLACVKQKGKLGFIDKEGNVIIPFKYEYVMTNSFKNGKALVTKKGFLGRFYIDKQGNRID